MATPQPERTAFPSSEDQTDGLSKRDYFAAHAPGVPDWWPEAPWVGVEYPPEPPEFDAARQAHASDYSPGGFRGAALEGAFDGLDWWTPDLQRAADNFAHDLLAAKEHAQFANKRARTERLAQWAWAYADGVLAARDPKPATEGPPNDET